MHTPAELTVLLNAMQDRDDAREVIRLAVQNIKTLRAEHREKQNQWWEGEQAWREQRAKDKVLPAVVAWGIFAAEWSVTTGTRLFWLGKQRLCSFATLYLLKAHESKSLTPCCLATCQVRRDEEYAAMRAEREEQRKKRQAELAGDPFSKEVCVPGRLSVPVDVSIS